MIFNRFCLRLYYTLPLGPLRWCGRLQVLGVGRINKLYIGGSLFYNGRLVANFSLEAFVKDKVIVVSIHPQKGHGALAFS